MARLTDFRLLCFDVYGTLIDWETGILDSLKPLSEAAQLTREQTLEVYHELEKEQQSKTPDMPYLQLLISIYPQFAARIGVKAPSAQESETFGQSVGKWPAFPDTVDALKRLSESYKMVVLSNVDRESFQATNDGPLGRVRFDKVITAQDVGSYKPDLRNFEYMLDAVKTEYGVEKNEILQTAQSQFHDRHPARKTGIKSAWIERNGTMGNREQEVYDWRFGTLGEMADAVEQELAAKRS
ncbi:haloacid dehalogenase, type II [Cladophialophora bantiana CBS 173.52]|uniref:Haloacid dehalogenase, type II n=1 Tax=Cladophialophora bantiana (strain ATCC 10958 / CBS 173.52 / CDC B-1940 / NIH 8579) TaxID=1442370 RepID=A0A0D2I3Y9_CLAB1|nr:haloacid dehalogenase, type II [Cladophialophora bantiana CBS 173.52]KIW91604.1 haloacid dehalogenase, type II [Cladophialophora bantiana CBS 173.52]